MSEIEVFDRRDAHASIPSIFKPAKNESENELNTRVLNEFQSLGHTTAIPYEYIGADLSSIYGDGIAPVYPDYYKLTPVYKMKFSGQTLGGHVSSFFTKSSGNFVCKRFGRWWNEDKVVTYCDNINKIASITSFLVLLITFAITVWQLIIGAQLTYKATRKNEDKVKQLDDFANSLPWTILKAIVSGFSAAVVIWNVYKRTTLPKRNIQIEGFVGSGKVKDLNKQSDRTNTITAIKKTEESPFSRVKQIFKSNASSQNQVIPVGSSKDSITLTNIYNGRDGNYSF